MTAETDQLEICPSAAELELLIAGRLSATDEAVVALHVEECDPCQVALAELTNVSVPEGIQSPDADSNVRASLAASLRARQLEHADRLQIDEEHGDPAIRIPGYQLLDVIGHGGMGVVYSAIHLETRDVVAVKVLPSARSGNVRARARFRREIMATSRLVHEQFVRVRDTPVIEDRQCLVMEYVDGINLAELLQCRRSLTLADACEVIRQAAIGLQYAHDHGMIHRDLKPSNLMLVRNGSVKILDLGLVKLVSSVESEMTSTGQLVGTIDYIAPEQGDPGIPIDTRADVYSLGATLFRLLTGSVPFASDQYDTVLRKLAAITRQDGPSVATLRSDLPADIVALVDRMRACDPDGRIQSLNEVIRVLTPYCDNASLTSLLEEIAPSSPCGAAASAETPHPGRTTAVEENRLKTDRKIHPRETEATPVRFRYWLWPITGVAVAFLLCLGILAARKSRTDTTDNPKAASQARPDMTVPSIDSDGVNPLEVGVEAITTASADFSVAEADPFLVPGWLLLNGANWVHVWPGRGRGHRSVGCSTVADLPDQPILHGCGVDLSQFPRPSDDPDTYVDWVGLLADCPELRQLKVVGQSPLEMQELRRLPQLTHLELHCQTANRDDFAFLQSMPSLEDVTISADSPDDQVFVDGIPDLIRSMKGLVAVAFLDCCFTDGEAALIERLPPHLAGFTLRTAGLDDSIWEHLSRRSGLGYINILSEGLTCEGTSVMSRLPNLQLLRVRSRDITAEGLREIGSLHGLRFLVLHETNVDNEMLQGLGGLESLERLELEGSPVTAAGVKRLQSQLPDCVVSWGPLRE